MPDIFKEYSKCYPTHAPGSMAVKIATASVRDMVDSNVKNLFKEDFSVESLAKRWNEVSKELISFVSGATPGDIYTNKVFIPYDTKSKPQQFRNTPPIQPAVLTNGTNVIDIGFVDFGIAIDAVSTIKHGEEPVTVYAFEKEPMCVAKCLVMLEMMKVTEVSPRSVLEVWMSTLWSKDTLSAFTTAVRSLLQAEMALQPQVRRVLEFWQGAPRVSQDAALKFWLLKHLDKMPVAVMHACNLTSERDRVALLRYELTGALYEDSSTTVGSLVMCNENSSIGKFASLCIP